MAWQKHVEVCWKSSKQTSLRFSESMSGNLKIVTRLNVRILTEKVQEETNSKEWGVWGGIMSGWMQDL